MINDETLKGRPDRLESQRRQRCDRRCLCNVVPTARAGFREKDEPEVMNVSFARDDGGGGGVCGRSSSI